MIKRKLPSCHGKMRVPPSISFIVTMNHKGLTEVNTKRQPHCLGFSRGYKNKNDSTLAAKASYTVVLPLPLPPIRFLWMSIYGSKNITDLLLFFSADSAGALTTCKSWQLIVWKQCSSWWFNLMFIKRCPPCGMSAGCCFTVGQGSLEKDHLGDATIRRRHK